MEEEDASPEVGMANNKDVPLVPAGTPDSSPSKQVPSDDKGLLARWSVMFDEEGTPMFINKETNETALDRPPDLTKSKELALEDVARAVQGKENKPNEASYF